MTASARRASGEIPQDSAFPLPGPLRGRMPPSEMFPAGIPDFSTYFATPPSGTRTRVVECGPRDGRVVLLLHGWGSSVYTFRLTMMALRSAGYRAIAIDLKGHGLTDKPEGDDSYTLPAMIDHVEEVLSTLGVPRFAIVAHSMGGAIAMGLHARAPGAITHLGLLASARIGYVPLLPLLRIVAVRPIAYCTPYACQRPVIAGILRFAHRARRRFTARDVDEYWAPTQYPAELRAAFALIRCFDWSVCSAEQFAAIDIPCLVMAGGRDRVISAVGVSSRVAHIPRVRYVLLDDEGHLFVESSHQLTNEQILALLARR